MSEEKYSSEKKVKRDDQGNVVEDKEEVKAETS
jgi:hypothetical protein